ncbi:hypothetical protein E4631_24845 [Hymenobacter sp. UV11]|uniref:hypothetical protein n=1 Tax=Hymenobacter sp. UV11 TaxID=1849735 RepID=UPI00105DFC2B|nr:hypothetical protein [Hymenobacter sp. UV11]TFZ62606.1 hypothetical protein E4631_24845 [Hymenobacter sp. UV11]
MKFNSLLTLANLSLLAMSTSCEKSTATDPTPAVSENNISGEWEWVKTVGGLTGNQTYTPSSTGVATKWVFKPDSTFQQYDTRQGVTQLTESTTFSIRSARSIYTGQPTQALRINRHVSAGSPSTLVIQPVIYIIEELGTELKIADNYADGFGQTYRRK